MASVGADDQVIAVQTHPASPSKTPVRKQVVERVVDRRHFVGALQHRRNCGVSSLGMLAEQVDAFLLPVDGDRRIVDRDRAHPERRQLLWSALKSGSTSSISTPLPRSASTASRDRRRRPWRSTGKLPSRGLYATRNFREPGPAPRRHSRRRRRAGSAGRGGCGPAMTSVISAASATVRGERSDMDQRMAPEEAVGPRHRRDAAEGRLEADACR